MRIADRVYIHRVRQRPMKWRRECSKKLETKDASLTSVARPLLLKLLPAAVFPFNSAIAAAAAEGDPFTEAAAAAAPIACRVPAAGVRSSLAGSRALCVSVMSVDVEAAATFPRGMTLDAAASPAFAAERGKAAAVAAAAVRQEPPSVAAVGCPAMHAAAAAVERTFPAAEAAAAAAATRTSEASAACIERGGTGAWALI